MNVDAPGHDGSPLLAETEEVFELAMAAATDATGRAVPVTSLLKVARVRELAKRENGAALLYVMYGVWIDGWMSTLRHAIPDIDAEGLWDQVNAYIDAPVKLLKISGYSVGVTRHLLGYRIDGDPTKAEVGDPDLVYDGPSEVEVFVEEIFGAGLATLIEVGVLLLFLLKTAFVEASQRGVCPPMQEQDTLRF